MRPSCRDCARKHLGQAVVLLSEAAQGYPDHYWLALGHLAEAGDELASEYAPLAEKVRKVRKLIELAGPTSFKAPALDVLPLIAQVSGAAELPVQVVVNVPAGAERPKVLVLKAGHEPGKLADGRLIADVVREHHEAAVAGKALPKIPELSPVAEPGCTDCEKTRRWQEALSHADMKGLYRRLVILTTLADFSPAYSLSTCVLEQAHAAYLAGYRVHIVMMDHAKDVPELPEGITIERVFPTVPWHEDKPQDADARVIADKLWNLLQAYAPCDVISHDLLFQAWFVSAAKAIHFIADRLPGVRWFHMAHSSVTARPVDPAIASLRASLPPGHHLITLNHADRTQFQAYYRAAPEVVHTLGNTRDPRPFHGMPEEAVKIVTTTQMHLADVVQVYPVSATRLDTKGIQHVINLFAAIKSQGKQVRLVIACGHANGDEGKGKISQAKAFARQAGLEDELVFTSDLVPESSGPGLSANAVRALLQVSNVFAFPTVSEASPLVLMEAALSGCLLVLNSSLPCLMEHVPATGALWVPWGSVKEHGSPVDPLEIASRVLSVLGASPVNQAKRFVMATRSIEAHGERLFELLNEVPGP
jgi:glycosyltransferase involved in cell wall biosynthesis